MCNFLQKSDPRNIDKSVSDIRIRIRFRFEISFWISLSGCKLTMLPDIQPVNRIVIISVSYRVQISNLQTQHTLTSRSYSCVAKCRSTLYSAEVSEY